MYIARGYSAKQEIKMSAPAQTARKKQSKPNNSSGERKLPAKHDILNNQRNRRIKKLKASPKDDSTP